MKMAKKLLAVVLTWCYGSVHADRLRKHLFSSGR